MYNIGLMKTEELAETLQLIQSVFMQYEAPDYSQQGVDTFLDFIDIGSIQKSIADGSMIFWIAKDSTKIIGALAVRNGCHICMLFVDGQQHRRGIATKLLESAFCGSRSDITVKSSPYGAHFYRAVGFVDTDSQQTVDGIVFIPMVCRCE